MPVDRKDMTKWILEALDELGGSGRPVDVCRIVWQQHQQEIEESGDMLYKWQYDIRWAKQILRDNGQLLPPDRSPHHVWTLASYSEQR